MGAGSIPGQEAKIPHDSWPKKTKHKTEAILQQTHKDFKNGPHYKTPKTIQVLKNN